MKPRKIAIVAEWLTSRGGAEGVVDNLLQIFPDADLYTSVFNEKTLPEYAKLKPKTSFLQKIPWLNRKHQLVAPLLPFAMRRMKLSGYDLIISSSSSVGKFIQKDIGTIHVCYCHTPMRYAWETKTDPRIIKLPFGKFFVRLLKKWDIESNKGVDFFISNSQYTASRIKKFYNRDATAIYPPVVINENYPSVKENNDFYFAISRLVSYKRIDLAIDACIKLNRNLIVAGDGAELENLKKLAQGHNNIKILGKVSNKQKDNLYKAARAVIFPADEDFGIVPIEANSFGTPVVAFNRGGCRETIQDGINGVLFERQTTQSICEAIEKLEKIKFNSVEIIKSAKKFSAENFQNNIKVFIESIK